MVRKGKMKILATSDIHGNKALIYLIRDIVREEDIDALIIAGDITPKAFYQLFKNGSEFDISSGFRLKNKAGVLQGDEQQIKAKLDLLGFVEIPQDAYNLSTISLKQKEKLGEVCNLLKTMGIPVYMLIGNDDHISDENWDKLVTGHGIFNLNLRSHALGKFKIAGFHYVLPTPWNTNNELPEDDLAKRLKHIEKKVDRKTILVTHGPPKGVLDRLLNGLCAGSESIFKLIKDKQPAFHIFGHIHEAFGNTKIGDTVCCNVSCFWSDWLFRGYIIDTQTRRVKEIKEMISLNRLTHIYAEYISFSVTPESERQRAGW